jgi:hypothetical protein
MKRQVGDPLVVLVGDRVIVETRCTDPLNGLHTLCGGNTEVLHSFRDIGSSSLVLSDGQGVALCRGHGN